MKYEPTATNLGSLEIPARGVTTNYDFIWESGDIYRRFSIRSNVIVGLDNNKQLLFF